jgi:outer membrane protein assembly factor BamE (lipoprotein component of BamABCDE complex)
MKINFAKALVVSVAAQLFLTGCMSMGTQSLKDHTSMAEFRVGSSTKHDVHRKFGQPHDVISFLGRNGWRYISADTSPEPGMFVLGVIFWPLLFAGQDQYEVTQADFYFDDDGKLIDSVVRKAQISKGITAVTDSLSERQQQAIERIKSEMLRLGATFDEKAAKQSLAYLAI